MVPSTPQELFEYKLKWKKYGHEVKLHSDYERQGVEWCKVQLMISQWELQKHTAPYEHTFLFEFKQDADAFLIFSKFFK